MPVDPEADPRIAALPVGTEIEVAHGAFGTGTATWGAGRTHRYRLSRVWDPKAPRLAFVMLNPSTADAQRLDPTVRRCVGRAVRGGYGAVEVVNIFALCATDPRALYGHDDPVGPGNDEAILAACCDADRVIGAWGAHGALRGRGAEVLTVLERNGVEVYALRMTRTGQPSHPLYLPNDLEPVPVGDHDGGSVGRDRIEKP